ncbi:MAG: hypothetical protein HZB64_01910 [Rhodocyclales bacterium]|nr:hypothetical protein [Rhodocyclales bacterium]
MRRFIVLLMLCLLPLQTSWAAVADYCGHGQGEAVQHFGHHDDGHEGYEAYSKKSDPDKQPGKADLGHDHCHLAAFLGLLSGTAIHVPDQPVLSPLRCDEPIHSSLALDRPERPKWRALA